MPPCSYFPTFLVDQEWEAARPSLSEHCPPHGLLFSVIFSAYGFASGHHGAPCPSGALQKLDCKRPPRRFCTDPSRGLFLYDQFSHMTFISTKSHSQTYPGNMPPVTYILLPCKLFHLPVISSHRSHFSFPPPRHPLVHPGLSESGSDTSSQQTFLHPYNSLQALSG